MSWTKTDHEGQTMWEQDGERLKEPPDERRIEVQDRVVYRDGLDPKLVVLAWAIGFMMGTLLATVMELNL